MDYEKKYKEALEIVKAYYNRTWVNSIINSQEEKEILEHAFPELKESEEEGIRKFIIDCIDELRKANADNADFNGRCSEAIAYLEKQKERTFSTEIEDEINRWVGCNAFPEGTTITPLPKAIETVKATARYFYSMGLEKSKMIQWTGENLKEVIDFTGKSPRFDEWFKSWEDFENYVHSHGDILKLFCEDGSHYEVPVGAWIVKTPDDFNVPSLFKFVQKPTEWSEDYREEDLRTRFAFYTHKDEDGVLYLSNVFVEEASRNKGFGTKILQAAEKVAEAIGATTIRLKVKQDSPANTWYRKHGYDYTAFEDGYNWREKTLEYLKPSKQEWSEEDEEMLQRIIRYTESEYQDWCNDKYGHSEIVSDGKQSCLERLDWLKNRLKSLRPQSKQEWGEEDEKFINDLCNLLASLAKNNRIGGYYAPDIINKIKSLRLRSHWKPSEEQMEAFRIYLYHPQYIDNSEDIKIKLVESLYNDLEKLM